MPRRLADVLDLGSLENNPNYKPEEQVQPEVVEQPQQEVQTQEDVVVPQEPTQENTQVQEEVVPQEPQSQPTEPSSLTPNNEPVQSQQPLQLTDDLLLKTLSEKLGKQVSNFDDLLQKPVEIDSQIQALNEWKQKTNRPIEDYFKFNKDYSQVSDLDIAREFLQLEYPTLTNQEVSLELQRFKADEDDLDSEIAQKNLELKKYATKGRAELEKLKMDLGQPSTSNLTPELKEQLDFAKQVKQQIEVNNQQAQSYAQGINQAALSTEGLTLNLDDSLNIDFKVSEQDRKTIPNYINEMPHWKNEDGSWNHKAVVQDSVKIKHFDEIVKLAYQQGLSAGKENLIKDTKNSTLGQQTISQTETGKKGPVFEQDIDELLGRRSLRFGY